MSTIFSKIIQGEIPCYKIAENEKFFAFLDIRPIVKGHTLVVPKKETDYIFDIEDQDLSEMMVFAKKIAKAQKNVISCKRIAVVVLGLEVPHAHIHLLPIQNEAEVNLRIPIEISSDEMKQIAEKISQEFSKI